MKPRIVLIGFGEHARVVAEAASAAFEIAGYTDLAERSGSAVFLGTDDTLIAHGWPAEDAFILGAAGLGPSELRVRLAERYEAAGARFATVVHPSAIISPSARVDAGAAIMAGAIVNAGAILGRHVIVNTGAVIEHDVRVGDHATIGPGAVVGGGTHIDTGAYVGLGARVRDHVTVGRRAVVGMGAVVVQSVAAGVTVMGVPARPARPQCR